MFSANGIIGSSELRSKFEKAPIENATEVMKIVGVLTDNGLDASIKPSLEMHYMLFLIFCEIYNKLRIWPNRKKRKQRKNLPR